VDNINTPKKILIKLSKDNCVGVRIHSATNENTASSILKVLSKDSNKEVRFFATSHPNYKH